MKLRSTRPEPARLAHRISSSALLARLIDAPDFVPRVRALAPASFASLVRRVGVEDAGELVALASTPQLVAAFDEDLFTSEAPGERERFDVDRFVTWLEVLLEAGDEVAAARFAELSESFVIQAISSVLLVLDEDALRARLEEGDRDARLADKALESALTEEVDGYLLVARRPDGWDAALALVVALDRDHRALLVRVLDRCAAIASAYVDDLESLTDLLSEEASLAEDVEAEREDRRSKAGFVEPRAAKSFLALARTPVVGDASRADRDPVTRAYFRELEPSSPIGPAPRDAAADARLRHLLASSALPLEKGASPGVGSRVRAGRAAAGTALGEAMRALRDVDPRAFAERVEELAYLTNVLVAGASAPDLRRLDAATASTRALAIVERGAVLASKGGRALVDTLRACHADVLFRLAEGSAATLASGRGTRSATKPRSVLVRERRRQPP